MGASSSAVERKHPYPVAPSTGSAAAQVKFGHGPFHAELKRRVDRYFVDHELDRRDSPRFFLKMATILCWFVASWVVLVFVAHSWWLASLAAISGGLALAGIGFSIGHDGGHGATSHHRWLNRVAAFSFDFIGASSYMWRWKHNVMHHSYPNIAGLDDDINTGILARLAPHQKLRRMHRFQHIYMFGVISLLAMKWQLFDDFRNVARGRIGVKHLPRPRGWSAFGFAAGKIVCLAWAFAIPIFVAHHAVWHVAIFYLLLMGVAGFTLAIVFQLAHCVEGTTFVGSAASRIPTEWAVHQIETAVDFARGSALWTWYLGGLNFQIEHHLFPQICHVHYRAIAPIVEQTCREFGVRYLTHDRMSGAIASHYRWLRLMGRPVPRPALVPAAN
jgi:linoleoyl-CoA desaturase